MRVVQNTIVQSRQNIELRVAANICDDETAPIRMVLAGGDENSSPAVVWLRVRGGHGRRRFSISTEEKDDGGHRDMGIYWIDLQRRRRSGQRLRRSLLQVNIWTTHRSLILQHGRRLRPSILSVCDSDSSVLDRECATSVARPGPCVSGHLAYLSWGPAA